MDRERLLCTLLLELATALVAHESAGRRGREAGYRLRELLLLGAAGPELEHLLPGPGAPNAEVATAGVAARQRLGAIDRAWFDRLEAAVPALRDRVAEARAAWGLPADDPAPVRDLLDHLRAAGEVFVEQCAVREALVAAVPALQGRQYEEAFIVGFSAIADEAHKDLHARLRRLSVRLARHNEAALAVLTREPELCARDPLVAQLREHLALWLHKYEIAMRYPQTAVVYVGVLEGKPFPRGVEDRLRALLR